MALDQALVSVIMPAHNAATYIQEAVRSVLAQTHQRVELIIVNDGSTDNTAGILEAIDDPRISIIHQSNQGTSHARNTALEAARGEFICFLDSDDVMPPGSIASRLRIFERDPGLSFVDGRVLFFDRALERVGRTYEPTFRGEPFPLLIRFDPACFFGNTWMIRREVLGTARFDESLTHVEDLLLYLTISPGRRYDFTTEPVLHYRITGHSSMTRLEGLERSYHKVYRWMREHPELITRRELTRAKYRIDRMMSGAYWHTGRPFKAMAAWFK